MSATRWKSNFIIWITLIIGLALSVLPLPQWAIFFRPEWVAMVLIYWVMALPYRVNLGVAWFLGLLVDGLSGSVLGQHAFAYTLIAYLTVQIHRQVRVFPLWQQALCIALLILSYQGLLVFIQKIVSQGELNHWFWVGSLVSGLLWPWVFILLRDCRRRFRVE